MQVTFGGMQSVLAQRLWLLWVTQHIRRMQNAPEPKSLSDALTTCVSLPAGTFRGVCKDIDHFAEDADYEQDAAEYLLRT